jgi:hypothetical protein
MRVFNRGIAKAQKTSRPLGGQIFPRSIVGERLAAKKAQKKGKEKHNFRNYKKNHAITQAKLNDIRVAAF